MAEYRYHFYDLHTGAFIDTLPVEGATFSRELRGVGTASGSIPLFDAELGAARVLAATIPYRTKFYVERDHALAWGGVIVPSRGYDSATGTLSLAAIETLGLLAYRFLPTLTYAQVEQLDIARDLIAQLQAATGGNLGLLLGTGASGILRDRNYSATDMTTGLSALTDLSEVVGGFEFATQVVWSSLNAPQETLLFGYPRLGRARRASGLVFEYTQAGAKSGNVIAYTWSDDAGLFTRSWASSDTPDGVQLLVRADNPALLTAGYPLMEQSAQFDGITDVNTLAAHATAMAQYAGGHHATAQFVTVATPGMQLGDWQLGDDVMVRVSDWRHPPNPISGAPGFADYMRITGVEVTPGGSADGVERYSFTLGDYVESL